MRLIDADKINTKDVIGGTSKFANDIRQAMQDLIDIAPTVDAEPVRHGEWEWFEERNGNPFDGYDKDYGYRCSCCKSELPDNYDDPDVKPDFAYCPNCGAKMKNRKKDGGSKE